MLFCRYILYFPNFSAISKFLFIFMSMHLMICLLGIKVKVLCPWMPLMKISLSVLQLTELFICFVQCEVIVSATYFSIRKAVFELPLLYNIFMGMIFRY